MPRRRFPNLFVAQAPRDSFEIGHCFRGSLDRVDAEVGDAGMRFEATHGYMATDLALVSRYHVHVAGLADKARQRL